MERGRKKYASTERAKQQIFVTDIPKRTGGKSPITGNSKRFLNSPLTNEPFSEKLSVISNFSAVRYFDRDQYVVFSKRKKFFQENFLFDYGFDHTRLNFALCNS